MDILVVEDSDALASYLVPLLGGAGYTVRRAATGAAALALAAARRPDLVLLDLGLPDLDGLDVCRELRALDERLPVVMLTARGERADEVAGFAAAADDYVVKPFHPQALLARVAARLRAAGHAGAPRRRLGDVEVDLLARVVRRDGRELALQPREFDLLTFLLDHPHQVFGATQLLELVWGADFDGGVHALHVRMSRLRSLIERNPAHPAHLHTRAGFGYYLTLEPT